jgi:hypothetical protein
MRVTTENWKDEMLVVAQSSPLIKEMVPFCIGFESPRGRFCVDFSTGQECDWMAVQCEIGASDDVFTQLIRGEETLQSLFVDGQITLQGDPERLLRLAIVFDECSRSLFAA